MNTNEAIAEAERLAHGRRKELLVHEGDTTVQYAQVRVSEAEGTVTMTAVRVDEIRRPGLDDEIVTEEVGTATGATWEEAANALVEVLRG